MKSVFDRPATADVLDEEIGYIVGMGADLRLNSPVKSLRNE